MPKRIAKERADNGTAHNRKTARSRNEEISDAMIAFIQAHIAFVKALSEIAKTADLS